MAGARFRVEWSRESAMPRTLMFAIAKTLVHASRIYTKRFTMTYLIRKVRHACVHYLRVLSRVSRLSSALILTQMLLPSTF